MMIDPIEEIKKHGSGRKAARALGIAQSTFRKMAINAGYVSDFFITPELDISRYAKILILDIEVAPLEVRFNTYDLKMRDKFLSPDYIEQGQTIISASWRWYGDDKTHCISISPRNPRYDREIVLKLIELIDRADVLSGHNIDAFDLKILVMRILTLGLTPLPKKQTIDTLKEIRKIARFPSNKLGYLAQEMNISQKTDGPDWGLVMAGDKDEIEKCRSYNKDDVNVSYDFLTKIMPHIKLNFDINNYHDLPVYICPKCGSHDTVRNGGEISRGRRMQKHKCNSCGYVYRETVLMRNKMNVKRI